MIFWLVFFPFAKHCGPFTKLSLNIQKNHEVFLCRTGRISNELEKVVQIYQCIISIILPIKVLFLSFVSDH